MKVDAWSSQGVFFPAKGNVWQHDGHCVLLKKAICTMADDSVDEICPHGNEKIGPKLVN